MPLSSDTRISPCAPGTGQGGFNRQLGSRRLRAASLTAPFRLATSCASLSSPTFPQPASIPPKNYCILINIVLTWFMKFGPPLSPQFAAFNVESRNVSARKHAPVSPFPATLTSFHVTPSKHATLSEHPTRMRVLSAGPFRFAGSARTRRISLAPLVSSLFATLVHYLVTS